MNGEFSKPETVRPVIVIDRREKRPLAFTRLQAIIATLPTGDYSIAGAERLFAVERKSLADLCWCATGRERERFSRALQRLRAYDFRRVLIVGSQAALIAQRTAWHFALESEARYRVPFVIVATPEQAARQVERWALWFSRDLTETARAIREAANPAPPLTPTRV